MAYPIKLFDFQTEEGRKTGYEFLKKLDQNLTQLFGIVKKQETQRQLHRWKEGEVPSYLTDLAIKSVQDVLKQLPQGEIKWRGSVGIYGRKTGSIIKREKDLLYRIVINLGDIEIYHLDGDDFNGEPVVLPNGYALLCSPVMIDKIDIKVQKDPIRKAMDPKFIGMVPKIRGKDYLRSTIVLDLLLDGLNITDLKAASVPKKETIEDNSPGTLPGPQGEQGQESTE
jgi:hypothetical protein